MAQEQLETLFEFPCKFPIKVMAVSTCDIKEIVTAALKKSKVDVKKVEMEVRNSSQGNYVSLTALFDATSKDQLDEIYRTLSSNPDIKMVL